MTLGENSANSAVGALEAVEAVDAAALKLAGAVTNAIPVGALRRPPRPPGWASAREREPDRVDAVCGVARRAAPECPGPGQAARRRAWASTMPFRARTRKPPPRLGKTPLVAGRACGSRGLGERLGGQHVPSRGPGGGADRTADSRAVQTLPRRRVGGLLGPAFMIEDPGHHRSRVLPLGHDRSALDHRATRWVAPRQAAHKGSDLGFSAHQRTRPPTRAPAPAAAPPPSAPPAPCAPAAEPCPPLSRPAAATRASSAGTSSSRRAASSRPEAARRG